jgi:hypothetical protein
MASQTFQPVSRDDPAYRGQAVYSPGLLRVYDLLVLGLSNRLLWRCPTSRLLRHYDEHVASVHLDVGPGSGYFLDRCRFPVPDPEITLLDLNPNSLRFAAKRIERYAPRLRQANVLEPFDLGDARFGSVAMTYLLHCLPGTIADKAAAFRHVKPYLADDAVVFGATILSGGVRHTRPSRAVMALYNRNGTFGNAADDRAGLERVLADEFATHRVEIHGAVALFSAQAARPSSQAS